ncbi:MAG: phosphohistidine phosphatase [Saprospiraceae bacterium]|nr:phosphohistidine phosphatase [Saprospiraceae bacterium]
MRRFLLIRHAKSSWKNPGLADIDRPLNNRGKRDAPRMAAYLNQLEIRPDYLASSPANRAFSTATVFYNEFKDIIINFEKFQDLYFGSEDDVMYIINNLEESISLPAIFFHNPTINYMSNMFSNYPIDNIPTCGVVHLESEAENWSDVHFSNTIILNTYFPKLI